MDQIEESLKLFQAHLDSLSDEELERDLQEIDKLGIGGPSVEEYFEALGQLDINKLCGI